MKKILFVALIALLAVACGKDKFQTTPQVEITSFGPDSVRIGELFRITANVTDKEGDLQDTVRFVEKRFRNNILLTTDSTSYKYSLKSLNVPVKSKFELSLTFSYGVEVDGAQFYRRQEAQNTEVSYTIVVTDNAGNKSDVVETRRIVLKRP